MQMIFHIFLFYGRNKITYILLEDKFKCVNSGIKVGNKTIMSNFDDKSLNFCKKNNLNYCKIFYLKFSKLLI